MESRLGSLCERSESGEDLALDETNEYSDTSRVQKVGGVAAIEEIEIVTRGRVTGHVSGDGHVVEGI